MKYLVQTCETYYVYYTVEADSGDEAEDKFLNGEGKEIARSEEPDSEILEIGPYVKD